MLPKVMNSNPPRHTAAQLTSCQSSFRCAINEGYNCVSSAISTVEEAMFVQIRWQESDLSLFETPPLTNGEPASRRHGGWDPDSSLLSMYTFPSECESFTDTWLDKRQKYCEPTFGNYYSPAICPTGWTAAYTRSVLDGYGPPVERDETAMFCCPRYVLEARLPDFSLLPLLNTILQRLPFTLGRLHAW